jgi:hypothetical protein
MILERVAGILEEWLRTGRFPREEFRVRAGFVVLFVVIVVPIMGALTLRALG